MMRLKLFSSPTHPDAGPELEGSRARGVLGLSCSWQGVADLGQRGIWCPDLVMPSSSHGEWWGHPVIIKEPSPAQTICWGTEGNKSNNPFALPPPLRNFVSMWLQFRSNFAESCVERTKQRLLRDATELIPSKFYQVKLLNNKL